MNILICHERFLFRFGVDRVLILLGQGLAERGHTVSIMANRYDRLIVGQFAAQIVDVPEPPGRYFYLNEDTVEWLRTAWEALFDDRTRPDVVIVGGWPFFAAIPFFRSVCREVVYVDFGAVPLEGYEGGMLLTQQKLRQLRSEFLPQASRMVAISDFIRKTQSEVDSGGAIPAQTILLGADHVENCVWASGQVQGAKPGGQALSVVAGLKAAGRKVILSLGRWETGCYKNSDEAFGLLRAVREQVPAAVLAILAQADVQIPSDLQDTVHPLGFPDDAELAGIMRESDLGVSLSRWEGFNLPLAEMQWLNKPALAFDLAAHPEVILHPWFLCADFAEMVGKSVAILSGKGLSGDVQAQALERFRHRFRWDRMVQEYQQLLTRRFDARVSLVIDVSNSTIDPANSGVIRLTRRVGRALQTYADPLFVVWESAAGRYVLPTREEYRQLGEFNGPVLTGEDRLSPSRDKRVGLDEALAKYGGDNPWLLMTETMIESRFQYIRSYARARHFRMAAVFHDAIPVLRPDLCNEEMRNNHVAYMRGLAECDAIFPNSPYSAQCLLGCWKEWAVDGCKVVANLLPGECAGAPRNQEMDIPLQGPVRILMVSTLEPRKNHRMLLNACLRMQRLHPELDWTLTLVGNKYAGAFDIADDVETACRSNPRIQWLGIVDDTTLARLYRESTFTVYPSVIEGFGLPIMESIWYGRPCLCANQGVMAEQAAGGGCLTADVNDEAALADALYRLATDRSLLTKLARQAVSRPVKTWATYAQELLENTMCQDIPIPRPKTAPAATAENCPNWEEFLYPKCLTEHWQMNDSERLGLTGILARLKPRCSIEVGTFLGGSLSLLVQYSEVVFSIDTDPSVPERLGPLPRVSYLTGDSRQILPMLLRELTQTNMPVEFVLIDGAHSADGIKQDVGALLQYVPREPLIVALHDSANPECRRGILEAGWERSPYCHMLDVDLIPGRIMENGGGGHGEMWGGLALAYFLPARRTKELLIARTADGMMSILKAASAHK
jgi:glycosyltransferase involved in cell wall biosynthesis